MSIKLVFAAEIEAKVSGLLSRFEALNVRSFDRIHRKAKKETRLRVNIDALYT